ncbi:MAG: hypothetical protein AMXMBFR13_47470 [Phycisphaerae bacterium]
MNDGQFEELIAKVCGYWPKWTVTNERTAVVESLVGRFDFDVVIRHVHTFAVSNSSPWGPDWQQIADAISREIHEATEDDRWGPGYETELTHHRQKYIDRGEDPPSDDWLIRQEMHREPPPPEKRREAREAIAAAYPRTRCSGNLADVRRIQRMHIEQPPPPPPDAAEAELRKLTFVQRAQRRRLERRKTEHAGDVARRTLFASRGEEVPGVS